MNSRTESGLRTGACCSFDSFSLGDMRNQICQIATVLSLKEQAEIIFPGLSLNCSIESIIQIMQGGPRFSSDRSDSQSLETDQLSLSAAHGPDQTRPDCRPLSWPGEQATDMEIEQMTET